MTTILSFLLVLLVVVAVHEMGHYLAARAVGVRVLRFSVGFGRPFLRRFDRRGTEWALAPIPLGGYVHLFDEAARKRGAVGGAHETIDSKSAPLRMIVLAAGPAANFVLAFLIYALLGVLGIVSIKPLIGAVAPQSPAAAAGVLPGDEIARVNGRETPHWHGAFAALVDAAAARAPTEFDLRREGRTVAAAVAADAIDLRAAANDPLRALGIAPESFATAEIAFVVADGAAERAGIQTGDEIVSIDGEVVDSWPQVVRLIEGAPLTEIEIVVWRDGAARAFAATPDGGARDGREIGVLGVAPTRDMAALAAARVTVRLGPIESALAAGPQTGRAILRSFRFLFHFVAGRLGAENIYGPIGIAQQSGDSARAGLAPFLGFIALLSVALGAVNLLPIPALDGGRLLLHALEIVLRRPLPPAVVSWAEIGGVAAVVALMAFAVAGDIMRLLS